MKRLIALQVVLCCVFVLIGVMFTISIKPSLEYKFSRPSKIIKNIRPYELLINSDKDGSLKIKSTDQSPTNSYSTTTSNQVSRSLYIYTSGSDKEKLKELFKEFRKVFKDYITSQGGTPFNGVISSSNSVSSFHEYSIGSRHASVRLHAEKGVIVMDITEEPRFNGVWPSK